VVFARFVGYFFPMDEAGLRMVAASVILVLSAVNYLGVRHGGLVQTAFTAAKVLAIAAIIAAGVFWSGAGPAAPVAAATGGVGARGFLLAIAAGLFAYGGWHMVTYAAGETTDAARTIPRALVAGVLVVTACYAGLNAIYLHVLPLETVRTSTRVAADAADAMFGGGGAALMSALVVISTFGAINGIILAGPRVYYAMARDGLLFRWLGAVHPVFGTPARAIVLQAVWASVLALSNTYGVLFSRVVYTEWIFFAAMGAGLIRLRRRAGYQPAWRMPGYPTIPAIFIAAAATIAVVELTASPVDGAIGLAVVLAGLPVYRVWVRPFRSRP
jgi:basic amino acid/polyamine antiporter, APA family